MTGQLETYRKEIFDFLRTLTIKFEHFAYVMGETYMSLHGLEDPHGEWNPYYLNLAGEYAPDDTRMEIYSVETGELVPFDKNLKYNYPKTAAIYKVTNEEYKTLEERYPENVGLIRTITYPIKDIQTAIEAPNLTLLAYDDSMLELNERESLVNCVKEFLNQVRSRWYVEEYTYEDMYASTFWVLLYHKLFEVLMTQRFLNIKTPYVHSFHIWEYLKSKGLNDYRDVLTKNQSLWLYRNINYIQKNKGKNSNLVILAENLLQDVYVSLLYKDMYQTVGDKWRDQLLSTPKFKSFNIVTDEEIKVESFETLNHRLLELKYENRDTYEFVDATENKLGQQPHNVLPTKYLEFKKEPINTSNERLMVNFFLDTLAYRFSRGDLGFECTLSDPVTNATFKTSVANIWALMYWSIYRSIGETPTRFPQYYTCHIAFRHTKPELSEIRNRVWYDGESTDITSLIDFVGMVNKLDWHEYPFSTQVQFISHLVTSLKALLLFNRTIENSSNRLYHAAMVDFFEDTQIHEKLNIHLGDESSYAEWRENYAVIDNIITTYEEDPDELVVNYEKLAVKCFDSLFPLDTEISENFIGTSRNLERIYTSIRDLFIQLGSYNVTYLETERDSYRYLKMRDFDIYGPYNNQIINTDPRYSKLNLIILDFWIKQNKTLLRNSGMDNVGNTTVTSTKKELIKNSSLHLNTSIRSQRTVMSNKLHKLDYAVRSMGRVSLCHHTVNLPTNSVIKQEEKSKCNQ